MHRVAGRVISVVLLLVLGTALSSLALGPEFDPPGHFDGDEDDVGLIWRTLSQFADIPVVRHLLTFIPSAPTEYSVPNDPVRPRHVFHEPHASRAPPARALPIA